MEDWYVYPSAQYEGDTIRFALCGSKDQAQMIANREEDRDDDERFNRAVKKAGRHLPMRHWIVSQVPPSVYYGTK